MLHVHKISKTMRTLTWRVCLQTSRFLQIILKWPWIPCTWSTLRRCAALPAMGALDVLIIPIHFAAAIPTTPSPYVNVISKGPCTKLPLIIPFTSAERKRHWVTLRPVVNIAMKRRVSRDMVVLVMHVLKIFLVDSVIHNIPPCIWIMVLTVETFPISPCASHVRVLSRSTLVVIIPCSVLITPLPTLWIPWFLAPVLFTTARKLMIPCSVFHTCMYLKASWGFYYWSPFLPE
jgi:hypothetical protein